MALMIETQPSLPMSVVAGFGCNYVHIQTERERPQHSPHETSKRSAFDALMDAQTKYTQLPPKKTGTTAKVDLYNHVLSMMEEQGVGFKAAQVQTTGTSICATLTNALWYIDPHHATIENRGVLIPPAFKRLQGFHDWRSQKKKCPQMSVTDLAVHIGALTDMVSMPWFFNDRFGRFKDLCVGLICSMKKYHDHLLQQQQRTSARHASETPSRSITDSWTMGIIEGSSVETKREYLALENDLQHMATYEPIFLFNYEPRDRYDRKHWLEKLALKFPVRIYQHHHGNYFGNFNFVWKIAEDVADRGNKDLEAIDLIRKDLLTFSTRAIRKDFIERYSKVNALKPAVLRDVYRFLTQDSSAAESKAEHDVDERVANFLLEADDPALFYDLRSRNGHTKDERLNPFWEKLEGYLEEFSVVHERRHGEQLYMPIAISLQNLIDIIAEKLPPDTPLPTVSWLRLNFWPSNAYNKAAMNYTGRFHVKFAVQQRLLRSKHPDSGYAFNQFSMMKQMATELREEAEFVCLDDKAIVPIGEPGADISSGVRAHNKSMVPSGQKLVALDHDFHVHGAIPSVVFNVDIPEKENDSFYHGTVHVTLKDKVFEPSTAMRHMTETISTLLPKCSNGVSLDKPILFCFTDGGPDHRSTFWTVQLAYIALFIYLDLDLLVTARTAPSHSYCNPAERTMSLLNLALQNIALSRSPMDETVEFKVKSKSTLKELRQLCEKQPQVKDALITSLEPVLAKLKKRFSMLKHSEENVIVHDAATTDEIGNIVNCLNIFRNVDDTETEVGALLKQKKDIDKLPKLKEFMDNHCRLRNYSFQVMKCRGHGGCWYCNINPPRSNCFDELFFLPDPTLDKETDEWMPLSKLKDIQTTDDQRPSAAEKNDAPSADDKVNKNLFVAGKVRDVIICCECGKRRVVYSRTKWGREHFTEFKKAEDHFCYTCGSNLFPDHHKFHSDVVVRQALSCSSPIEITYYAGVTHRFHDICYYCGNDEVVSDGIVAALRTQYSIVRPICQICLDSGKQPAVRNALKVGTKRK